MRKATLSVIAGNPPADGAHPSGMNGMIVKVAINEKHAPRAPRIPSFLFQKPARINAPNNHSETPSRYVEPFIPKTEYIQKISGPWVKNGIRPCISYSNHFWYPKKAKMITMAARIRW